MKVNVLLSNREAILSEPYPYDEFNDVLKYRKVGWEYTPSGRLYSEWKAAVANGKADPDDKPDRAWDGYIHMLGGGKMGAGLFLAMKEKLELEGDIQFQIQDRRRPPDFQATEWDDKARDYQIKCVESMFQSAPTGGLILNATGTGKTYIAGMYFSALLGAGLFLVDELALLKQSQAELTKVIGEPVGEIGNGVFDPKRITVATIQTIHRHRYDKRFVPWARTLQTILIDEVHLALNRSNFQTIAAFQPPTVFGLTATLELKKKHVAMRAYDLCGPVVYEYALTQGVEEGVLSKGVVVAVEIEEVHKTVKFHGGNYFMRRNWYRKRYQEEYVDLIVEGPQRNRLIKNIIETAYKRGKYCILLLERVQHLKNMSQLLRVPHHLVFGEKSVDQRVISKLKFELGDIRVILANKVFKKGIDIKRVDIIIDGAAMKSRNDCVQKYGRGVRMHTAKKGLIYFDVADKGNRFEKAAKGRRVALKKIGVPIYKVDAEIGVEKILDLAEKKLEAL